MIDENKLKKYIMTEINPYGKPFDGTVFEFGNMLMDYIERMEKEPKIVHCKDCKLRKLEECAMQYECDCGEQHSWENDNDYCSWGIKAGEQNG